MFIERQLKGIINIVLSDQSNRLIRVKLKTSATAVAALKDTGSPESLILLVRVVFIVISGNPL